MHLLPDTQLTQRTAQPAAARALTTLFLAAGSTNSRLNMASWNSISSNGHGASWRGGWSITTTEKRSARHLGIATT